MRIRVIVLSIRKKCASYERICHKIKQFNLIWVQTSQHLKEKQLNISFICRMESTQTNESTCRVHGKIFRIFTVNKNLSISWIFTQQIQYIEFNGFNRIKINTKKKANSAIFIRIYLYNIVYHIYQLLLPPIELFLNFWYEFRLIDMNWMWIVNTYPLFFETSCYVFQ